MTFALRDRGSALSLFFSKTMPSAATSTLIFASALYICARLSYCEMKRLEVSASASADRGANVAAQVVKTSAAARNPLTMFRQIVFLWLWVLMVYLLSFIDAKTVSLIAIMIYQKVKINKNHTLCRTINILCSGRNIFCQKCNISCHPDYSKRKSPLSGRSFHGFCQIGNIISKEKI